MKSANMHRWNIFLIEALSMLALEQIKTVKPSDNKPGISDKPSFFSRRSVRFQFFWQKLLHSPGRAASKDARPLGTFENQEGFDDLTKY